MLLISTLRVIINLILILIILISTITTVKGFSDKNKIVFSEFDKHYYFIVNSTYCKIDRYNANATINYLGFNDRNVESIRNIFLSDFTANNNLHCPIKSDKLNPSCDNYESYKNYLLLLNDYHTNKMKIIDSMSNIGPFFNPSITTLSDKSILLFKRSGPTHIMMTDKRFKKFKMIDYIKRDDFEYEIDYRLVHVPDEVKYGNGCIYIVFSYEKYYPRYVISGVRKLFYDITMNSYTLLGSVMFNYDKSLRKEKNWSPFLYNNEIYFVQQFVPFRVIKFENNITYVKQFGYKHLTFQNVTIVSEYSKSSINWNFGDIRGGTSAFNIHGYGFLGFFHSRHCSNYLFGAYIFSDSLPFHLLKISRVPIITNKLIYNHEFGTNNLSIVFPLSYLVEDRYGNDITSNNITSVPYKIILSVGYNDSDGLILRLDFNNLIDSLSDVSY